MSRKEGFAQALGILRAKGVIGILVDQNAGMQGALTLFFDRVASTTELPGVLAAKFSAEVRTFYPRRTGFWRVQFESDPILNEGTPESVTVALNLWLETKLASNADLCASWLWSHDRWRTQDVPERRLRVEAKRNFLPSIAGKPLPRRTRIWIRMPNWLGDVVMAVPLIRAIRASRPDAEITLVTKSGFAALLAEWRIADSIQVLPAQNLLYFQKVARLKDEFPDVWISLTNSVRGDLEAWLSGAPQRFGIVRPGKWRPLLSHTFVLPADYDETKHHQIDLWSDFLTHFGLRSATDLTPFSAAAGPDGPIGLIAGSENNPEKRWPIARWRNVVEALPNERFVLFGTANDAPITAAIANGFSADRIEDLAGKTDLSTYCLRLKVCRLLVANDTGGMHLANALGVPVIGLFGPTNPLRTGPLFSGPLTILQPDACPPAGGMPLTSLTPDKVIAAILASSASQVPVN